MLLILKRISEVFPCNFQKCWEIQHDTGKEKLEKPETLRTGTYLLPENWDIMTI